LKDKNSIEKKIILRKLVNSGINITPSLLEIILNLEDPLKKLNLIIKDSSFIASFKSHLTEEILTKMSNEEIRRVVKRKFVNPEASSSEKILEKKDEIDIHQPTTLANSTNSVIEPKVITDKESSPITNNIRDISTTIPNKDTSENIISIEESNRMEMKPIEGAKSTSFFTPVAKEYDFQLDILKDPTGKIYTNGVYKDFYDYTFDKFNRLKINEKKN